MMPSGARPHLRIGLFAHRLAKADVTGVGRYVQELTRALAQAAGPEQALVLASTPEAQAPTWVPPDVALRIFGRRRPLHAAWTAGTGPRVERSLGHLDVVHLLYPFPPLRSRAPQILTVHDVLPLDHPSWYPSSERLIFRRTISLAVRRATRIVVPSAHVKDRLSSLPGIEPGRVSVIPHGISRSYADSANTADGNCLRFGVQPGRYAVCLGAVSTRKNLVPVIRGLARLGDLRLPLLLVGPDGHGRADAEAEIARLGDSVEVRRTGFVADEQAAALVKHAAVLVHPALAEGFGLVPLEAMAVGTPVVAARVSSIPEVVGDAAVLVDDPDDPAAWADAMRALIGDRDRRLALARAGEKRATLFGWERTARSMLALYRDVAHA